MVEWNLAKEDTYYQARRLEEAARRDGTAEAWREFASLKAGKGSYVLACYGFFNSAVACEQMGDADQALQSYTLAFQNARRARSKDLALMAAYRHAALAERLRRWETCIGVYEAMGTLAEELGNHFLAADAYEHAAEIMLKAGKPAAQYDRPVEQWKKNAVYWREQGNEDDALWSERHITLYQSLFGAQAE